VSNLRTGSFFAFVARSIIEVSEMKEWRKEMKRKVKILSDKYSSELYNLATQVKAGVIVICFLKSLYYTYFPDLSLLALQLMFSISQVQVYHSHNSGCPRTTGKAARSSALSPHDLRVREVELSS
jgi:hypothetical protein